MAIIGKFSGQTQPINYDLKHELQNIILLQQNNMSKPFWTGQSRGEQGSSKNGVYTVKLNVFTQAIKRIENLPLVSIDESSARYEYAIVTQTKKQRKLYLQLAIKKNFLHIKTYLELDKFQIKYVEKDLLVSINKINTRLEASIFLSKIFFQSKPRLMVYESSLNLGHCQNLSSKEISTPFVTVVKDSFQTLKEIQEIIIHKKLQLFSQMSERLNKAKDSFEQNRIKRQKSTKISLHSKDMKDVPGINNIWDKIIMHYKDDIKSSSPLSRQLRFKYNNTKQKAGKEPNTFYEKLKEKVNKQKQGETSRGEFTSSITEHNKLIHNLKIQRCYIFKPICIFQEHYIQTLESGGFGQVFKYRCVFQQLDTVASQSQKQINEEMKKRQIIVQRAQLKDVLIRKNPKQSEFGKRSFNIQYQCLSFLRSLECPQIAQFYKVMDKKEAEQNKQSFKNSIYSKYYPHQLAQCANSSFDERLKVMLDLIEGIQCLSDNKILHRDIKPNNIRLTTKFRVKIIDFGSACLAYGSEKINQLLANEQDELFCTQPYTLHYAHAHLSVSMSKEQYTRHVYYDLYAYGIILQKMFNERFGSDEYFGNSLRYLYEKSMEHNPEDRLSPQQIRMFLKLLIKSYQFYSQI